MSLKVLIVGSGTRVNDTLLPAILCLREDFELIGILTKSQRSVQHMEMTWGIKVSQNFGDFKNSEIDLIIIAVTTRNIRAVIASLSMANCAGITIMLDTPVFSSLRDFKALSDLSRFKNVLVTEDCIALPQIRIARELINSGRLGTIKKIQFQHSGFKYHAIAMARKLTEERQFRSCRTRHYLKDCNHYLIGFNSSVEVEIIEPRDYEVGRLTIIGTQGVFSDYPINHAEAINMSYQLEGKRLTGLLLENLPVTGNNLDTLFFERLDFDTLRNRTLMNQLKIRGVIELLMAVKNQNPDYEYHLEEGLYDAISSKLNDRLKYWFDPLALAGTSIIRFAIRSIFPSLARILKD